MPSAQLLVEVLLNKPVSYNGGIAQYLNVLLKRYIRFVQPGQEVCLEKTSPETHISGKNENAPSFDQSTDDICPGTYKRPIHLEWFGDVVQSIVFSSYNCPGEESAAHSASNGIDLERTELVIITYWFQDKLSDNALVCDGNFPGLELIPMPNARFHHEWKSLVFEDRTLPYRLLRFMKRMAVIAQNDVIDATDFDLNRVCLLYGPPGSGKTTLCLALAQKLSIQLLASVPAVFQDFILIKLNVNSLLSKYFGESGKQIDQVFKHIRNLTASDKTFVCITIDEVETIAASRERAVSGNDCSDGLRATNQLLQMLDEMRRTKNSLVLCTTNMLSSLDPAFLSRVDLKQHIPSPSGDVIYDIFRSRLNALMNANIVTSMRIPCYDLDNEEWTMIPPVQIPARIYVQSFWMNESNHPDIAVQLLQLSRKCVGFSARTCRRLPIMALALFTCCTDCSLDEAFEALQSACTEELLLLAQET